MTSSNDPVQANPVDAYEPLFSYGHLRGRYAGSKLSAGMLAIPQFARPEHLATLREHLLKDQAIFTLQPNTRAQLGLSPVSRQCLWELHSGIMLRVLENITGIHHLLPDPHCRHSGFVLTGQPIPLPSTWRDDATGLEAALVILLRLDNGEATLCTTPQAVRLSTVSSATLCMSYWQHRLHDEHDKGAAT